jgi:putative endonuclease
MDKRRWFVYLIRCSDKSLYCGTTNNLKNRLEAHNSGKGAKYTRFRRPVELVAASSEMTKSDALKLEYRVKQLPASKKNLELTKEENKMTKELKKDLQAVKKGINALVKKTENLLKAVEKLDKPKSAKKPIAKPVKAPKKAPAKKAAVSKAAPVTTADTVLEIIKGSEEGVNTESLMKKTGYNQKKIANLVYKLKKQGKIKSPEKGIYVRA